MDSRPAAFLTSCGEGFIPESHIELNKTRNMSKKKTERPVYANFAKTSLFVHVFFVNFLLSLEHLKKRRYV